jgi:hypothetical protein
MEDELLLEGKQVEEENKTDDVTPAPDTSSEEEPAPEEPTPVVEENGAVETSIKTFTQDDMDRIVGETRVKTRQKTFDYVYNRYGVKSEEELDALVANAQRYDTQKELYDSDKSAWETEREENNAKLTDMSEQIALMQSGVDKDRYEDVKLILKGKNIPVTVENIEAELETHPEWMPAKKEETVSEKVVENPLENAEVQEEKPKVTTRIKALGNEPKPAPQMSEEEEAERLFKLKFH